MIISIRLKNFFSLKDDAVIDFTADVQSRRKQKALEENLIEFKGDKFVNIIGLFGSNAAGKSNIIKAIDFCRRLVLESHLNTHDASFDFEPFKFDKDNTSEFYIDFVTQGTEYEYSFTLQNDRIVSEELFYYPNNRKARIFSRIGTKYSFGKGAMPRPGDIETNTGDKTLFLSMASSMNRPIAQIVYRFFQKEMVIGLDNLDFSSINLREVERNKDLLLKAFEVSDSDIIDIQVTETTPGNLKLLSFHRENPSIAFDFAKEESDGTKRLLIILTLLLRETINKATVFLDEFDLKLHIRLAEFLLDVVRASHGGQLVFTSHNPILIDTDKLRGEQIVFVNKLQNGNSEFMPLSDFEGLGKKTDVRQAYLMGRFDAVPYIGNVYDMLTELIERK